MICPFCSNEDTKVLDSRVSESAVRRRRECIKCVRRFTTYEKAHLAGLIVIKKDGRRQPFSREKLLNGLTRSCEKTSVSEEQLQKATDEIESMLRKRGSSEVSSKDIGKLVLTRLKKLDKIAYIRFKSVYHEFDDVDEFKKEINVLAKE